MKYLIYFLLLVCSKNARGQNRQIVDSLNHKYIHATQDTIKVLALSELAFQYRFVNTDSAMKFAQDALILSRQINYKAGEAASLNNIAFLFREKGNLPLAMELHFKVQQLAKDNQLYNEGALSMTRLGNIYRDLKDYNTALFYQRQAVDIFESTQYKRGITIAKMLIGITFQEKDQLDSALYYEIQARSMIDTAKFSDVQTAMLNAFGKIYAKLHNYPLAFSYYRQCARTSLQVNDHRSLSQVYTNMAQLFSELKQVDSSILYAGKSLENARKVSNKAGVLNAATTLSLIYEPIDLKKSLEYYKITMAAKDSLYGNEKLQALQTVKFNEQERQRNFEMETRAYQIKMKQYALVAGLACFFIIALFLYRNNRQKQQTNTILQQTLADLKLTQAQLIQSEKMASLGELTAGIAHEIQNPLNFVNNFSEVNQELAEELKTELSAGNLQLSSEIANDISENSQKINLHGKRADAIVKGMLQHSRLSVGQKELTDVNALADEYLKLAYHGLRAKDKAFNATLQTDFEETIGKINIISQDLGRVLLNLYNNAFYTTLEKRKSKNEEYEPSVIVSTKKEGDKVFISVSDNGNGIAKNILDKIFQPFFTTKPTGSGTGLGLSMAYDIVKAHGGELKVESKEGEGSRFVIQLPV